MKKLVPALFLLALCLSLASCAQINARPTDLLAEIITDNGFSGDARVWFSEADRSGANYMPRELAGYLYAGNADPDFDVIDRAESFAVYVGRGLEIQEIHIFKAKSLSETDRLLWMLNSRAETLNSSGEESYFKTLLKAYPISAEVRRYGKYVVMAATAENDAIFEYLERTLG